MNIPYILLEHNCSVSILLKRNYSVYISRLQPDSSIFSLTKYIRQIVQYLVVYRISVFGSVAEICPKNCWNLSNTSGLEFVLTFY